MSQLPLNKYLPNVSRLAYGCMGLGGAWNNISIMQEQINQADSVIDTALENNINLFDHADIYTMSKAEQVFGKILSARPQLRENIYIQSKCGIRFADENAPGRYDFSANWITQSVNGILTRLNTDYIDILMLHRPDPLMELDDVAESFSKLKQQGKVKYFGVSNMSGAQIGFLQSALNIPIVVNQIEMSLQQLAWLDEGILATNPLGKEVNFTAGTLEYCQQNNVQLQAWGSLCGGLFSGQDITQKAQHIQQTAHLVTKLANYYQVSKEAIVLAFLTRHPAQIQPVIGTTNLSRIKACKEIESFRLNREHWYSLYVSARGQNLP